MCDELCPLLVILTPQTITTDSEEAPEGKSYARGQPSHQEASVLLYHQPLAQASEEI